MTRHALIALFMGALHEYLRYAPKKVEKPSLNAFDPGDGSVALSFTLACRGIVCHQVGFFADPRQGFALYKRATAARSHRLRRCFRPFNLFWRPAMPQLVDTLRRVRPPNGNLMSPLEQHLPDNEIKPEKRPATPRMPIRRIASTSPPCRNQEFGHRPSYARTRLPPIIVRVCFLASNIAGNAARTVARAQRWPIINAYGSGDENKMSHMIQ